MSKNSTDPQTTLIASGHMSEHHFGVVNTPVYRASTVLFPDLETMETENVPYTYGIHGSPTSTSLQEVLADLDGADHVELLSSGLAAVTTAILAVVSAGDHLLMVDSVYWPARHFCDTFLKRMGVETSYYDPALGADIAKLFRPNTRAVYCESPGTHTFEIQDIPAIAEAAHEHGIAVLADNTWATPILFDAFAKGVDLSIHAATKYICGHSDVMMGTISVNAGYAEQLHQTMDELGHFADGDSCYLALRGLRTLALRLKQHEASGLMLAKWLQGRKEVERVLHPALPDFPTHNLWKRDFTGACGLFSFVLKPLPEEKLNAFFTGLQHFGIGYSWGGYESLMIPAKFTRSATNFADDGPVIRIHAGLENPSDLVHELDAALRRAYCD